MYYLTTHYHEECLLDAWQLIQFLGGKDAAGDYYTARHWYRLRCLGFAFKSLLDDLEIIDLTELWGDIEMVRALSAAARICENIRAPWYPDFNFYSQPEIQKIFIRQLSPRDGLARIAKRCRELKQEWT